MCQVHVSFGFRSDKILKSETDTQTKIQLIGAVHIPLKKGKYIGRDPNVKNLTSIEDYLDGGQQHWKITSINDDINENVKSIT